MNNVETRGMTLTELWERAQVGFSPRASTCQVRGISTDSRHVHPGDLFIGLPGEQVDGGQFWPQALAAGAVAAVISDSSAQVTELDPGHQQVWTIPGEQLPSTCAQLASAFYDFPGQALSLIGVTGTNGKTTTTHLIDYLLNGAGCSSALIGTLYARWSGQTQIASHTTPFAVDLHRTLAQIQAAGCQQVVMEVSSHALAQQRVWGCPFQVAVWTNLTQDHLDYHPTLEDYWQAKALLFSPEYLRGRGIINQDDPGGRRLLEQMQRQTEVSPWSFSLTASPEDPADLWPEAVELASDQIQARLHTPMGEISVQIPMAGAFNLANLMAAVGAVLQVGLDPQQIQDLLPHFPGVPGRMEMVQVSSSRSDSGLDQDLTVIVDYAHTPDGLENLLRAVRPTVQGQLICVFGCGGDRDRTKRPQMGRIAAEWSDQVVVTSDNPRTEDPEQILQDILAGFDPESVPTLVQGDRRQAIGEAILGASPRDTVVIAGKGHEDYQILGTTKIHFDDREVAREMLLQRLR